MSDNQQIQDTCELLDKLLAYKAYFEQVPGIAFGVVKEGELVYKNAHGFSEKGEKLEEDHLFKIASISKVFTAKAVMKLREDGKLKLDDKINEHLDCFNNNSDIRVRHLLSHISGSVRDGKTDHWTSAKFPNKKKLEEQLKESITVQDPVNSWKYSNLGYGVLGKVIESVSGKEYGEYVEKEILEPLNMKNTFVDGNNFEDSTKGFGKLTPEKGREEVKDCKTKSLSSATGYASNIQDLSKFILDRINRDLLDETSYREMEKIEWELENGSKWSLGQVIWDIENRSVYGHTGGFLGHTTVFGYEPDSKTGIVILTNGLNVPVREWFKTAFRTVLKAESQDLKTDKENLDKYTGRFTSHYGEIDIRKIGNALVMISPANFDGRQFKVLTHVEEDQFMSKDGPGFGYKNEIIEFDFEGEELCTLRIAAGEHKLAKRDFTPENLDWLK